MVSKLTKAKNNKSISGDNEKNNPTQTKNSLSFHPANFSKKRVFPLHKKQYNLMTSLL
jgi:hypothetical protein